ncbi:MAG: tetratricopeptide repeat protein [Deltaproteobacteria bacterium]|jgi:tetratricopeptide (TPR) repeat protein|nr:tetratricopeptide repeat protein [Deltaproteobacteria bacterium]
MTAPSQAARRFPGLWDFSEHCPLLALGLFLLLALFPLPSAAAEDLFLQDRPFRGLVRRDAAEKIAAAAARQMAVQAAMRLMVRAPGLRFAFSGPPLPLEGLADEIYATETVALGLEGFPPNMRATAAVRLIPPQSLREALIRALRDPESLELRALLLARRAELIAGCDLLAGRLLSLNPHAGEGDPDSALLLSLIRNLEALDIYDQALRRHGAGWRRPDEALKALGRAGDLAPDDPLILLALAGVLLRLDQPAESREYAAKAGTLAPDLPQAQDLLGTILLRQGLPVLAADAFSRAVELAPGKPAYLTHRAFAHLILEQTEAFCADFRAACALGDCEGYSWARAARKCPGNGTGLKKE